MEPQGVSENQNNPAKQKPKLTKNKVDGLHFLVSILLQSYKDQNNVCQHRDKHKDQ